MSKSFMDFLITQPSHGNVVKFLINLRKGY